MTRSVLPPRQIVYLACQHTRLYGEVIQVLTERQRCWVRPLWLVTPDQVLTLEPSLGQSPPWPTGSESKLPDLIWPMAQIHLALDSDVFPLLAIHPTHHLDQGTDLSVNFSQFINGLWQATAGTSQRAPTILPSVAGLTPEPDPS